MTNVSSTRGSFALVSYIPDPLATVLQRLQHQCGGGSPKPHITILPPRPLCMPFNGVWEQVQRTLLAYAPFEVELSDVRCFSETGILYLDISHGAGLLHDLHAALNHGDLDYRERFDFRPHLTLTGPLSPEQIKQAKSEAQATWSSCNCSRRFVIEEVVSLWLPNEATDRGWHRVGSHDLRVNLLSNCGDSPAPFNDQTY